MVVRSLWDEKTKVWTVETSTGEILKGDIMSFLKNEKTVNDLCIWHNPSTHPLISFREYYSLGCRIPSQAKVSRWAEKSSGTKVCIRFELTSQRLPNIPGLEDFSGASFHRSEWEEDFVAQVKRIAVIGTGASAVQLVPALADQQPASLTVFQRWGLLWIELENWGF